MDYEQIQAQLGFTADDKANWIDCNSKYYSDPEQGWRDKLMMHAFPKRTASVYVMPAYQSPITGKWIDTPRQRRDDMARSGSRPWEGMDSERKVAENRVKFDEKKADAAIESAVVEAYKSLGPEKQAVLENSI
jgi:hypothetical protein